MAITNIKVGQSFYLASHSSNVKNGIVYVTKVGRKKFRVSFDPHQPTGKEFVFDTNTKRYAGELTEVYLWGLTLFDSEQHYLDLLEAKQLATDIHFLISPELRLDKLKRIKAFIEND